MPDKKLTDNEIVKALERCSKGGTCEHCPLKEAKTTCNEFALDLINRLQAKETHLLGKIVNLAEECEWLQDTLETTKAEAYKEFAEKLKLRITNTYNFFEEQKYPRATITDIDRLLKELVGEDK